MFNVFVIIYLVLFHTLLLLLIVYALRLRRRVEHLITAANQSRPIAPKLSNVDIHSVSDEDVWRENVKAFVALHIQQPQLQINDVAKAHFMSKRSFQRRFKLEFGVTFGSYLTMVRMTSAVELLQQQFMVSEVAALCGYADLSYFSFCFKQYYGLSPSAYLQQNSERNHSSK